MTLAHHGTAAVAFAGVLALLATRAHEAWVKIEARTQPRPSHLMLAYAVTDDRHVDFFQNVLVLAKVIEGILTPTSCPTSG